MIGKGEIVMSIIELYDALEASKRERDRPVPAVLSSQMSKIDEYMIAEGRDEVYAKSTYSWTRCIATRDDETGAISVTPYEKWLNGKVHSVPDYMSRSEFCEYFADRLRNDYEREKQDAIAKLAVDGDDE